MALHVSISEERLAELQSATRQDPDLCMLADENHPIRLAGTQERGASKPADVFSIQRKVVYTERADLKKRKKRTVIPAIGKTRESIMQALHKSHTALQGCLRRAREVVYWPGLHTDLERFLSQCEPCQTFKKRTKPKNHQ